MKLGFLLIGAQKAGTTALYRYLYEHPQVNTSNQKELHFFDYKHQGDYTLLHSHFVQQATELIRGECTPIYLYWKDSIKNIYQYNPNIKLIIILRNPINRAYSHWNMEYQRNAKPLSFSNAIRIEKHRLEKSLNSQHRVYSYIDRGMYYKQLQDVLNFFPIHQLLILKFEQFRDEQEKYLKKVFDFLEVDAYSGPFPLIGKKRQYSSGIPQKDKKYLFKTFKKDIESLEKLLDWNCSDWKI